MDRDRDMECEICGAGDAKEYHLRQHNRHDDGYDDYKMVLCNGCFNLRISQDWIERVEDG